MVNVRHGFDAFAYEWRPREEILNPARRTMKRIVTIQAA
jgi:hypothetical protein